MTTDSQINFYVGASYAGMGASALPAGVNSTYTYARWVGYLIPSTTGVYTIGVNSDDGANVFVSGQPIVVNLAGGQTANLSLAYKQSGTINLTKGVYYELVVEWQNAGGSGLVQLAWTPPGGSSQLVPSGNLSISSTSITGNLSGAWWNGTALMWYPTGVGAVPTGYTGPWSSSINYFVNDETSYLGNFWKCLVANLNSAPSTTNTNWQLVGTSSMLFGAYAGGTAYVAGNQVTYSGNIYTCILASTGNLPTNATYWTLMGPSTLDNIQDGSTYLRLHTNLRTSIIDRKVIV